MAKFSLTKLGENDLLEIGLYTLENHGAAQKQKYLAKLDARFQWLANNPRLGSPRDEIKAGYKSWNEGGHAIFYRVTGGNIEIIGIPHQSMDIEQRLSTESPKKETL